uniref:Protein yippee-like n=1 Tax=Crocodylus porosus TaxID=8502 RepID=A0A7M4EZV2_CROPO
MEALRITVIIYSAPGCLIGRALGSCQGRRAVNHPCVFAASAADPERVGHGATHIRKWSFQGSQGRAYLFNSVVNVGCGPAEERVLLTGLHAVADIYCENCKTTLGWKYEHAFESSQKYKEGKYIIELAHMIKDNGWD